MNKDYVLWKRPDGVEAINWLSTNQPKSVLRVFNLLVKMIDGSNGCLCSLSQIAIECEYGTTTVKKAMNKLRDHQFITWSKKCVGLYIQINGEIVERRDDRKKYLKEHDLWSANILIPKGNKPFNAILNLK